MPDVETVIGDVYTVTYIEECDSVEVDIIVGEGQSVIHPATTTIDVELLSEKDLEKILKALIDE